MNLITRKGKIKGKKLGEKLHSKEKKRRRRKTTQVEKWIGFGAVEEAKAGKRSLLSSFSLRSEQQRKEKKERKSGYSDSNE
ncbi:unnamed protein product [Dovyalis caffra]|uniref:Uncharacterized protein n=1 Tax=Dovyalis caffra TaxID=77055 RepID=A0AAV1RA53_9ROSI|nr:unnamed protein product [Dovyalis caffra]